MLTGLERQNNSEEYACFACGQTKSDPAPDRAPPAAPRLRAESGVCPEHHQAQLLPTKSNKKYIFEAGLN